MLHTTAPRLFVPASLREDAEISLDPAQAHYVRNVMRMAEGGILRLFNGRDGEYAGRVAKAGKTGVSVACGRPIRAQPPAPSPLSLLFAPIRKNHMDFMIEKAVELGVTALHPVITAHTQTRHINAERLRAQITEAAEQCERLDIPALHEPAELRAKLARWDGAQAIHFAAERLADAPLLSQAQGASAFLIGPEGGFSPGETAFISGLPFVEAVSLGPRILKADTAALVCLTLARRSGA